MSGIFYGYVLGTSGENFWECLLAIIVAHLIIGIIDNRKLLYSVIKGLLKNAFLKKHNPIKELQNIVDTLSSQRKELAIAHENLNKHGIFKLDEKLNSIKEDMDDKISSMDDIDRKSVV